LISRKVDRWMARIPKSPEFVQDDWSLNDHLALDVGMRISSQSMGRSAAVAPRAGLAYSPGPSQKTIIRAGRDFRNPLLVVGSQPGTCYRF
jgi:outer membrane receptor for ferrienterochelin and colicin